MLIDVPSVGDNYYQCNHRAWAIAITVILVVMLALALADYLSKRR